MLTPIFIRESEIEKEKKESACNAGDLGLIPGPGRSLDEGNGYLPAWRILWSQFYPWSHKELDMTKQLQEKTFPEGWSTTFIFYLWKQNIYSRYTT